LCWYNPNKWAKLSYDLIREILCQKQEQEEEGDAAEDMEEGKDVVVHQLHHLCHKSMPCKMPLWPLSLVEMILR
jgi:hypothetical protein